MTPLDQDNKNYIQIGIGETNHSTVIGERQYDTDSINYFAAPQEKDATTTMAGFEDPYVVHAKKLEHDKEVKDEETERKHKRAESQTWVLILIFSIILMMVIGFVVMYYLRSKKESQTFDTSKAVEQHNQLIDQEEIQEGENLDQENHNN